MANSERGALYGALWACGLAFGWIEGATVVYLFALNPLDGQFVGGLQYPLNSLPTRLIAVEVAREACTLVVLAAVGWIASRRWAGRIGAFLLLFGIWDLVYYATLWLVAGWPDSLTTWDILFLIPAPWVAPVWAPASVAALFVGAGSYLFWTEGRVRAYARADAGILLASAVLVVASFLIDWQLALDPTLPHQFPPWLFWSGVASGMFWFLRVEGRAV